MSAFTVRGYLDGVAYALAVDTERQAGDDGIVVSCAPLAPLSLLRLHAGSKVSMTPTGPVVTVSLDDPRGVVAGLLAHTDVIAVEGDVPAGVMPESRAGVVY